MFYLFKQECSNGEEGRRQSQGTAECHPEKCGQGASCHHALP